MLISPSKIAGPAVRCSSINGSSVSKDELVAEDLVTQNIALHGAGQHSDVTASASLGHLARINGMR